MVRSPSNLYGVGDCDVVGNLRTNWSIKGFIIHIAFLGLQSDMVCSSVV